MTREEEFEQLYPGKGPWKCKICGGSFIGDEISEDIRHYYSPPYRWVDNVIGIEPVYGYDGIAWWKCLHCGGAWDRFTGEVIKNPEEFDFERHERTYNL